MSVRGSLSALKIAAEALNFMVSMLFWAFLGNLQVCLWFDCAVKLFWTNEKMISFFVVFFKHCKFDQDFWSPNLLINEDLIVNGYLFVNFMTDCSTFAIVKFNYILRAAFAHLLWQIYLVNFWLLIITLFPLCCIFFYPKKRWALKFIFVMHLFTYDLMNLERFYPPSLFKFCFWSAKIMRLTA